MSSPSILTVSSDMAMSVEQAQAETLEFVPSVKRGDRIMYDSVNPYAIPRDAKVVAGYFDGGSYSWSEEQFRMFEHAEHLHIDRTANRADDCGVLDIENGTVGPGVAREWCESRRKLYGDHARRILYCNLSTWPAVRQAVAGLSGHKYWIANPTGYLHGLSGAVAVQCQWPSIGSPGQYDVSLVTGDI